MTHSLLCLAGDGIGPEVMAATKDVVAAVSDVFSIDFDVEDDLVGGASYDVHGIPVTDAVIEKARNASAVLFGAVGGPQYDDVDYAKRPEQGLLDLRKQLDLFANLRPAICFGPLASASSLKTDLIEGLDILIVRELTSGVYFGEPRGISRDADGKRVGVNTQRYTEDEIARTARVAFELARTRSGRVMSVEKGNVMESGKLWRQVVTEIHADENYGDVDLQHMYADNCAMQLVRAPKQFDVIVTDNLFGDMLSDQASMLTGSIGMLPSASLGQLDGHGRNPALYEPVHGSAPDIAGKGLANPCACILSFAMALQYSLGEQAAARAIFAAVDKVLADGIRTADIAGDTDTPVSTADMARAIITKIRA
ncbi:MAG: 3-isopropylmalate dehydrogenase [Pseudomonadota bacterium]